MDWNRKTAERKAGKRVWGGGKEEVSPNFVSALAAWVNQQDGIRLAKSKMLLHRARRKAGQDCCVRVWHTPVPLWQIYQSMGQGQHFWEALLPMWQPRCWQNLVSSGCNSNSKLDCSRSCGVITCNDFQRCVGCKFLVVPFASEWSKDEAPKDTFKLPVPAMPKEWRSKDFNSNCLYEQHGHPIASICWVIQLYSFLFWQGSHR